MSVKNASDDDGTNEMDSELIHLKILIAVVPIVVPILFTLVIIIGFIGNLLVVLVVILNKTMRNTTNILIFNLAVSKVNIEKYSITTLFYIGLEVFFHYLGFL